MTALVRHTDNAEVAIREPEKMTLAQKMDFARAMASADLLPRQYRGNPANLLFALEYADALGVSPINAITSIHVIEGKPSASAELISAMIRRAGHRLRVTGDDTQALAQLIRADDPEFVYEAAWDIPKAQRAGLTGKAVWKNYPAAMLRSRAITEVARMGATDALFGIVYTPEELGAEVDATGIPSNPPPPPAPRVTAAEIRSRQPRLPQPPPEDAVSRQQLTALHAGLGALGYNTRDAKLDYLSKRLGREVGSSSELTYAEASRVLDDLRTRDVSPPDAPAVGEGQTTIGEEPPEGWQGEPIDPDLKGKTR